MAEYFTSDFEHPISKDALRDADRETQLEVMETWFRQHFEDPAERTPYESAEGGYIWIWGGPYDAREELECEFSGVVTDDVIDELAGELEGECWEWAPTPSPEDYDDYLVEDIARITEYHRNFSGAILDIKKLLKTKVDDTVAKCFWRLLYVNVITALETYLSDAFISTVVNSPELMRRFIETTPEFQAEKVPFSEGKNWGRSSQYSQMYLHQVWIVIVCYYGTTGEIGCTRNTSSCYDSRHRGSQYFLG